MSSTWVINVRGTGNKRYSDSESKTESTWIETYNAMIQPEHIRESLARQKECTVHGCNEMNPVGAHVQIVRNRQPSGIWYIVPFCHYHNHSDNDNNMQLKPGIWLIPVKPSYRALRILTRLSTSLFKGFYPIQNHE